MLHDRSSTRILGTDKDLCDYEIERKELQDILHEDLSKNEELQLYKKQYKSQILELKKMLKDVLREKKSKKFTLDGKINVCVEVNKENNTLHCAKEGRDEGSDSAVDGLVDRTVAAAAQPSILTSVLTSTSTSTPFCGVVLSPSRSLSSLPTTTTTTTTSSIQCRSPSSPSSLSPSPSPSPSSYNQSKCTKNHSNAATSIFAEVLLCVGGELHRDKKDLMEKEKLLHDGIKKCRKEVRTF